MGSWHTVKIMMNGIDTRIVREALFGENIQRPERGFRDGPTGSAIALHFDSRVVFYGPNCGPRVISEFVRCERINGAMPIAMAGQFVFACVNIADEFWELLGHPPHEEKRPLHIVGIKQIQNAL